MAEVRIPVPVIEGNAVVDIIRGSVRPLATLGFVGMFIWAGMTENWSTLPTELVVLGTSTLAFWFGGRFAEKQANSGK